MSFIEGCVRVTFQDRSVQTFHHDKQASADLFVLAALGHDNYRGIRKDIGTLLNAISNRPIRTIKLSTRDKCHLVLQIDCGLGPEEIKVEREPADVTVPYSPLEVLSINAERITDEAAARSLAPLSYSTFLERAKAILEIIISKKSSSELFKLPPLMLVTGLTDVCNQHCPFCFRERDPKYSRSDGSIFTETNLTELIVQAASCGVKAFRFCGEGEDTLHPQYLRFLLLTRVSGMNVMQITNGTTLKKLAPILVRCVDFLRVSVNGWTTESYQEKHGLRNLSQFERILDGLRTIKDERRTSSDSRTVLSISTVLGNRDCDEYDASDFTELVSASGADCAILKQDKECMRFADSRILRLRQHGGSEIVGPPPGRLQGSSFYNLIDKCASQNAGIAIADSRFRSTPKVSVPDWIGRLKIGCVLRYLRAEVERLEVFNCSVLHQRYGDIRTDTLLDTWLSGSRIDGIRGDTRRLQLICDGCGWTDLFRVMNFAFDQVIRSNTRYSDLFNAHYDRN